MLYTNEKGFRSGLLAVSGIYAALYDVKGFRRMEKGPSS